MSRHTLKIKTESRLLARLPLACVGLLVLLLVAMLCPPAVEDVEAADTLQYLPSSVQLTMGPSVSASVEPTSSGVFQKMQTGVGITISSSDAFSVSLRGDSEMRGSAGNNVTIKPVSVDSTEAGFGKNQWGYSWAEGNTAAVTYNPVPSTDVALVNNQKTVDNQASKTYTLGFGAKVDSSIPPDTYTSSVTVSVVATPQTIVLHNYVVTYYANGGAGSVAAQTAQKQEASWSFIAASGAGLSRDGYEFLGWSENAAATTATYKAGDTISLTATSPQKTLYAVWKATGGFGGLSTMQGMTPDICKNAKYGETARLEDTRDGKEYWVTKLADGNCWMTQNLDFDIPAEGLSIATGSKLDWNPGNPTNKTDLNNSDTATNTNSWDQGMYVYNDPTASANCGNGLSGIDKCTGGAANSGKTFINVGSGYTASDDSDFTSKNGSPVNTSTKVYDAHYLIGNYYTFNAATAGTGTSVTTRGSNASSDICPAGNGGTSWELPSAGDNNNTNNSFYRMLVAQGMTNIQSTNNGYTGLTTTVNVKGSTDTGATAKTVNVALTTAPLFFVRSGRVEVDSTLYYPGLHANYWSRSASDGLRAFSFMMNGVNFASSYTDSGYGYRYFGRSLRCLYHPVE